MSSYAGRAWYSGFVFVELELGLVVVVILETNLLNEEKSSQYESISGARPSKILTQPSAHTRARTHTHAHTHTRTHARTHARTQHGGLFRVHESS